MAAPSRLPFNLHSVRVTVIRSHILQRHNPCRDLIPSRTRQSSPNKCTLLQYPPLSDSSHSSHSCDTTSPPHLTLQLGCESVSEPESGQQLVAGGVPLRPHTEEDPLGPDLAIAHWRGGKQAREKAPGYEIGAQLTDMHRDISA